jgi:Polyketide cyclase / dehydrase and lipid transport
MGVLETRIAIDRPLTAVFAVYIQPDTFRWCSYIRSARWECGKPWEEESRLLVEIDQPMAGTVDQVLTRYEPQSRVDFISHFGGITLITRVRFRAVSDRETEITAHQEFVGTFSRVAGFAVGPAIEGSSRQFFADLKKECERVIPKVATRAANLGGGS